MVIAVEVQLFDDRQRRREAVELGDRDRAIERDDRCRHVREKLVVQRNDLRPLGARCGGGISVDRGDGSLNLVRARHVLA